MDASKMLQTAVLGFEPPRIRLWLQQVRLIVRHLDEMAEPIPRVSASHAIHLELGSGASKETEPTLTSVRGAIMGFDTPTRELDQAGGVAIQHLIRDGGARTDDA